MKRFHIISNRLPVNIERRKEGLNFRSSVGGLATGLRAVHQKHKGLWFGWSGIDPADEKERELINARLLDEYNSLPIFISQYDVKKYYYGFSNRVVWPLFHYFPQYCVYDPSEWKAYQRVNQIFCDKIVEVAKPGDVFWIHDYHLMLLPELLRQRLPKATIGFFLHIPFPSMEIFRYIPWRNEILKGLLGADLIGFQTYGYTRHFLNSVLRLLGIEHEYERIMFKNRIVSVDIFPIGIDFKQFADISGTPQTLKEADLIKDKAEYRKIILSVDRLDYTKGIPERLIAFERFLDQYPEWREMVKLIMVCTPSRTKVGQYQQLKRCVDELVGRINGQFGTPGWTPILYLYRFLPLNKLIPMYQAADVALIMPLRDGMNLVAKEYLVAQKDSPGVLILSEMTGAAQELGEAIMVNPNNADEISEAINNALAMPEIEQVKKNRIMQDRISRYDIFRWANDFIEHLLEVKKLQKAQRQKKLSTRLSRELINNYYKSERRLILLDYDGTLISFSDQPEKAEPDKSLLNLLKGLTDSRRNKVVIISGRDPNTLDRWLGGTRVSFVAEHGAWIRDGRDTGWEMFDKTLSDEWKDQIRPLLTTYCNCVPRSLLEEKDFSLVWHYRKADPELAAKQAKELMEVIEGLIANTELQIFPGNKIIEVKPAGINKGRVISTLLQSNNDFDFILAAGDDITDEDMFRILPDNAYTIKVGIKPSAAKFYLDSPKEVRSLLGRLIK